MKLKIIKSIIFVVLLLIMLSILSFIFYPKDNRVEVGMHSRSANGILAEQKDSIDVLFVGNSEAYTSVIPNEIWNDYGYTSYICGTPHQTLPQTIRFIHEVCETQRPKIIMLESNSIFMDYKLSEFTDQFLNSKFKVFQYHNRWKTLKRNDLRPHRKFTNINDLKGYEYTIEIKGLEEEIDDGYPEDFKNIARINTLYVKDIIDFCNANEIKFVIYTAANEKYWNFGTHNALQSFCDSNNVEYLDLNMHKDEVQMDWMTDTSDYGDHLNYYGALKSTKFIGKYLNELSILEDHREDEKYSSWNECYSKYINMVNKDKKKKYNSNN